MRWFEEVTGLVSDAPAAVHKGISVEGEYLHFLATGKKLRHGRLSTPDIASLSVPLPGPRKALKLREAVGDVAALHRDPENAGAVFQVASQFNLLEMTGPDVTPESGIAQYAFDPTQGPACAMACAAGTIYRNYFVPLGNQVGQTERVQLDMLADFGDLLGNQNGSLWQMKNGYLLPRPGALELIGRKMIAQGGVSEAIRVGVCADTVVTQAEGQHCVTQVYCSALPIAYCAFPASAWEPFARMVLRAAYQATFAIAWQSAQRTGQNRLYLTRLGGGAFGNPTNWITEAIHAAMVRFSGCDLDVVLVSHARPDPANRGLIEMMQR